MNDLALPRKSLKEIAPVPHTPPNPLSPQLPRGSERNQRSASDGLETQMGVEGKEAMGRVGEERELKRKLRKKM